MYACICSKDNNADDISQKIIQESEQDQLDAVERKLQDKEEQLFKPGDLQKNYEKPSFNEEYDQLQELMQLLKGKSIVFIFPFPMTIYTCNNLLSQYLAS